MNTLSSTLFSIRIRRAFWKKQISLRQESSMCILWRFKPLTADYNRIMDHCRRSWGLFENHFKEESGEAEVSYFLKFVDKMLDSGKEEMYHSFITQAVGDVFDSFDLNQRIRGHVHVLPHSDQVFRKGLFEDRPQRGRLYHKSGTSGSDG